ncbi:glycosyltransferase [Xinfangfangia sp. D13-10-4-6]|uniref:glycosyltransferase n=1 Tax=Pseudogemmobacter hezensis TaxID=2737662 RepID=UPI0015518298|nr:glycosyltransferase [Pseudogemmobacter hezensis]NPD13881.1 glycosyltransferase [Pseudogemmobacter hezensis]
MCDVLNAGAGSGAEAGAAGAGLALSVIIPASNEEAWIAACLQAVFASDPVPGGAEVIVVANGCRDRTAEVARDVVAPHGWRLRVEELAEGSKPGALNAGDRLASGRVRAWLDADCVVSPGVMPGLVAALTPDVAPDVAPNVAPDVAPDAQPDMPPDIAGIAPLYAGATPVIPRARSWVTRAYARFWQRLPFARSVAPGFGLYAVNPAGRARWGEFPRLISDDTFVRLQFTPAERVQIAAPYDWPMIEGFAALVKVRRRQDQGVRELEAHSPGIFAREGKARLGKGALLRLALRDPLGFATYAAVTLAVRRKAHGAEFTRGR